MSLVLLLLACGSSPTTAPPTPTAVPSPFDTTRAEPRELTPWGLPVVGSAVPADAPAPEALSATQATRARAVIAEARRHLDRPYRWEGRNTERAPDFDCLGILFRSYGEVTDTPWQSYSVNPSELVASGMLGEPVPGINGVPRAAVPVDNLMPGDVLYFLDPGFVIDDAPLAVIDGDKHWPWHTGLYVGDGEVLHADPRSTVRVQPLAEVYFIALVATRLP